MARLFVIATPFLGSVVILTYFVYRSVRESKAATEMPAGKPPTPHLVLGPASRQKFSLATLTILRYGRLDPSDRAFHSSL